MGNPKYNNFDNKSWSFEKVTPKSKTTLGQRAERYITEDFAAETLKTVWKTSVAVVTVFAMLATSAVDA
jgi:hypothetical protein